MGIPSFYRHLLRRFKNITSGSYKSLVGPEVSAFMLDFNCIIYAAMKTLKPVASEAYEVGLRREVGVWLDRLVSIVEPKDEIFIAVDGPVPLAKIHQQRLRRFKSVWIRRRDTSLRAELGLPVAEEGWDRNAITPGTIFMDEMNRFLATWSVKWNKKGGSQCIVSDSGVAGEGEHKVMRHLSEMKGKNVVIYGLDADLILLGMLHAEITGNRIVLCRENGEGMVTDVAELTIQFFDPTAVLEAMWTSHCRDGTSRSLWLRDYVAIMSVLGNDFMPHSLGWSIRDDAIGFILDGLETICFLEKKRLTLDGKINYSVLLKFFQWCSAQEYGRVANWLRQKKKWYPPVLKQIEPFARACEQAESEPMVRQTEMFLLEENQLSSRWRQLLETFHFSSSAAAEKGAVEFIKGFQWVYSYYLDSTSVDVNWYYSWSSAPTFATLAQVLEKMGDLPSVIGSSIPVSPITQLVMVLPPESHGLLPPAVGARLGKYFEFLPESFSLEYFGHRFLWECEPIIPFMPRALAENIAMA
jgi:5'-3' exoribonuclease 2